MLIGYARVSSEDQSVAPQTDALRRVGCERIFHDHGISGSVFKRPALDQVLALLSPGDVLVVWKLDRLGRSMMETTSLVLDLDRLGIGFRSLTEGFDTKTALGRGVLAFIAAIAEDESERIRERTRAGMASAKARGVHVGRPLKLDTDAVARARIEIVSGLRSLKEVARAHEVSPVTLSRALKRLDAAA